LLAWLAVTMLITKDICSCDWGWCYLPLFL